MARNLCLIGSFTLAAILASGPSPLAAGDAYLAKKLALLNKITGNDPLQGILKDFLDRPEEAKKLVQLALPDAQKLKGLSYNAAFALALAAADQKDLKASETFFRVCMDQAGKLQSVRKLLQSYGTLIELYYEGKKYADSARICKELLDLKTDDGTPRLVLRTVTTRTGETDFTEDDGFDVAKRLRPTIFQTLIKAVSKQGKHDQAIKMVDGLIKEQDHWLERQLKGWVLREAGMLDDATAIYEDVIARVGRDEDLEPDEKDLYVLRYKYELSSMYVDLKKIDKATEQLEYLMKKRPNDPGFYNDLGYIWADNDMKLDEAEKLVRKALELDRKKRADNPNFNVKTDQDNGAYLDSLGWVQFKQKKLEDAKKSLLDAVKDKNAQHIEIYDHLGDVLMALGERQPAIDAWRKGLEFVGEGRREADRKAAVERKLEKLKDVK